MTDRPFRSWHTEDGFFVINTDNGHKSGSYDNKRQAELEAISSNDVVSMNAGEELQMTEEEQEQLNRLRLVEALLHYFGKKSKIARALGAKTNSQIVYLRRVMSGAAPSPPVMKRLTKLLEEKVEERRKDAETYL